MVSQNGCRKVIPKGEPFGKNWQPEMREKGRILSLPRPKRPSASYSTSERFCYPKLKFQKIFHLLSFLYFDSSLCNPFFLDLLIKIIFVQIVVKKDETSLLVYQGKALNSPTALEAN